MSTLEVLTRAAQCNWDILSDRGGNYCEFSRLFPDAFVVQLDRSGLIWGTE